ncbi:expressed unknown protein [Seminavis robusta]|uniref:G-protein coupled receptors family 3 profile domain-containing protein n=1 Tax=Seminavis robusta TaxID=568900 RepID=A0A9N8E345_9STRA|nr:expressed unknown protein [Seminavis robusta]|eukprot:Sro608_g174760.1 n/a (877) ;mRNA; r:5666-8296
MKTRRRQQKGRIPQALPVCLLSSSLLLLVCCCIHPVVTGLAPARLSCDPSSNSAGDSFCRQILQDGSYCDPTTLRCTSPFASRGCFDNDGDSSHSLTVCQGEECHIRIHAGNWDSSLAMAWIYQIILTERLQVPTAVVGINNNNDNTDDTTAISFYHPAAPFVYADQAYDWEGLQATSEKERVHVLPEVWNSQRENYYQAIQNQSIVHDPVGTATGIWGQSQWYVPTHTAQAHPALLHYYGLQQATTLQLADIFRQPYTWGMYCDLISTSKCQEPNAVAQRAPSDDEEVALYHVRRLYTGYFGVHQSSGHVIAHDNSSNSNSNNNTLATLAEPWNNNNISLQQSTHDRESMKQIWKAAMATQSHVMMAWWTPDSFLEAFRDEFQPVTFLQQPQDARTCLATDSNNCQGELLKAISTSLLVEPQQNPAYQAIRNLRIAEDEWKSLLKQWGIAEAEDPTMRGFTNRKALCDFVQAHWDEWEPFVVPKGFPHHQESTDDSWTTTSSSSHMLVAAQVIGGLASLGVLLTGILTVRYRTRLALVYAQIHFVWQVLLGFWFVTMAAVLYGKEPTDRRCLSGQWLLTLGLTLVHVPLLIKVANINRIAAQSLEKYNTEAARATTVVIRIAPLKLFMVELALTICVIMYLMIWTAYDPPSRTTTRVWREQDDGSTLVETSVQCSSRSDGWVLATFCWQAIVLACTTVLAVLSQQVVDKFKETKTLGLLIYCQDLCLVLQVVLFLFEGGSSSVISASLSLVLSLTSVMSCAIYFAPLFSRIARGEEHTVANDPRLRTIPQPSTSSQPSTELDRRAGDATSSSSQQQQPQAQQLTLGMGSASSDLNCLIQNRLREFQDAEFRFPAAITAECSRSMELDASSIQLDG